MVPVKITVTKLEKGLKALYCHCEGHNLLVFTSPGTQQVTQNQERTGFNTLVTAKHSYNPTIVSMITKTTLKPKLQMDPFAATSP